MYHIGKCKEIGYSHYGRGNKDIFKFVIRASERCDEQNVPPRCDKGYSVIRTAIPYLKNSIFN